MSQEEISNKEYIKLHSGGTWVFCAIIVVFALLLHLSIIHEKDFTMPYRLTQIDSVMQTNPQTDEDVGKG